MNAQMVINTPNEYAEFVLDELGRWVASECPIVFKARGFKTPMFSFLYEGVGSDKGLVVQFTKSGYVVIKICPPNYHEMCMVSRFHMANPGLQSELAKCFEKLNSEDTSDFSPWSVAKEQWKKSS